MEKKNNTIILLYGTCPDMTVAKSLARSLLDAGLVACVNLVPGMVSLYQWQGQMEESAEVLLIAKTQESRVDAVKVMFAELHPYDEPALIALPVRDGLDGFLRWVAGETG